MLIIVLPVFNEQDGISDFLDELNEYLGDNERLFVVVDDQSTDDTKSILDKKKIEGFPLVVIRNEINKGHGYSVITGIKCAIDLKPDAILLCDGDGQFHGVDIKVLVDAQQRNVHKIVEGARFGRDDPWFRKLLSFTTRLLVWRACKRMPKDANTPLRVMSLQLAILLINEIEDNCLIPNMAISALSRVKEFEIDEIRVRSLPPRRNPISVDQWKQKTSFLPSKRLIKFVFSAITSWKTITNQCVKISKLNSAIGERGDDEV